MPSPQSLHVDSQLRVCNGMSLSASCLIAPQLWWCPWWQSTRWACAHARQQPPLRAAQTVHKPGQSKKHICRPPASLDVLLQWSGGRSRVLSACLPQDARLFRSSSWRSQNAADGAILTPEAAPLALTHTQTLIIICCCCCSASACRLAAAMCRWTPTSRLTGCPSTLRTLSHVHSSQSPATKPSPPASSQSCLTCPRCVGQFMHARHESQLDDVYTLAEHVIRGMRAVELNTGEWNRDQD